jgi:hypothetical protein
MISLVVLTFIGVRGSSRGLALLHVGASRKGAALPLRENRSPIVVIGGAVVVPATLPYDRRSENVKTGCCEALPLKGALVFLSASATTVQASMSR